MNYSIDSKHVMLGIYGVDSYLLKDRSFILQSLFRAATESGATIVGREDHKFEGGGEGIAMVLLLSESHISIHTWPECGHAQVDIFTCGNCDPKKGAKVVFEMLGAKEAQFTMFKRPNVIPENVVVEQWVSGMGWGNG